MMAYRIGVITMMYEGKTSSNLIKVLKEVFLDNLGAVSVIDRVYTHVLNPNWCRYFSSKNLEEDAPGNEAE